MRSQAPFKLIVLVVALPLLVLASARIARSDGPQEHPLFSAIRRGDLALLESHLREGVVNVQSSDGMTPLMLAALHGTPETVRLLLAHGADPNAVNKGGASALLFAVGDLRKVELLLGRGADVNVRSSLGNTPLIAAAAHNGNLSVVKLLLNRGARLHAENENNISALAAAVMAGDTEVAGFLLEQGVKSSPVKNLFGSVGNPLLVLAAQAGNNAIVELLLTRGADVNATDSNFIGHALNYALLSQRPDTARRLIEAGADLKLCSPVGKVPPIVLAAYLESGDPSIAKSMIEHGTATSAASQAGETALTWARRRGFPELVALLEQAGTPDPADHRPALPNRELPHDSENRDQLIRDAIKKSISLLQASSDIFLENRRNCVSCHHQNLPSVALGWARDRGFAVDQTSTGRIIDRQVETWSRRVAATYEMDRPFPVPAQLLGYGLWGLSALGYASDSVTDATVWYLAATQHADGHWGEEGISRPPMGLGEIMATTLAMRALQLYPMQGRREETAARIDRARSWLASSKPALHQDRVYKLLGLAWSGVPVDALQDELNELLAAQRPDGGWPQLAHLDSDAWATGQALVVLRVAGQIPRADSAYQRGIDYLLRTQFDDGSWYVQSRAWPFQPPFDSGFPFGRDQWISAGATAWATMALVLDIEPTAPAVVPSRSDRPASVALAPASTKVAERPTPSGRGRTQGVDFVRDIKPILERSCAVCHSGEKPEGGFRVTQRDALVGGGESGERAVVPGRSGQSPLFMRVWGTDPDRAMPPLDKRDTYAPLSNDELEALRAWIDEGANWPSGASIKTPANYTE